MEIKSKVHAQNIVSWARKHPEVVILSADLTGSTEIDLFRDTFPDRFFSMGVAEQNMISFAGGLAREGFVPFVHTFAVFIYRQALNQIINSVAYSNLPVKFFGFLPGITTPGGATHQAIEDVAVMRSVPNMTVLEPGDATEVESILDPVLAVDGPVYVRMLRGEIPKLFRDDEPFVTGAYRFLSRGTDITLVTAGICTEEAMRASAALTGSGISVEHVHLSTHKPFNSADLVPSLRKARHGIITMENHTVVGGLGTEVSEVMAENGIAARLRKIGLYDTFAHGGSKPYLMKKYGLDAAALVRTVEELLGRNLSISESDLEKVRVEPVHSMAKAEGL